MARLLSIVECIHYVDFSGDLAETICGLLAEPEIAAGRVTVFLSSPTCPECQQRIQERVGAIGGQLGQSSGSVGGPTGGLPVIADSRTSRIWSFDFPA